IRNGAALIRGRGKETEKIKETKRDLGLDRMREEEREKVNQQGKCSEKIRGISMSYRNSIWDNHIHAHTHTRTQPHTRREIYNGNINLLRSRGAVTMPEAR